MSGAAPLFPLSLARARMNLPRFLVAVPLFAALGCAPKAPAPPAPFRGSGIMPDELPLRLSQRCPGDPSCLDGGDGKLLVGFGLREITPMVETFDDVNDNGRWDPGEPYRDLNGNGRFDPVWMTVSAHQAFGVHDPQWVRCYVLRQNQTTLAHCALDVIGYFHDDLEQLRADLPAALGIDYLMTSATHDHSNQDTLGLYGPADTITGYNPVWMKIIRQEAVAALTDAVAALKPAKMSIGSIPVEDGPNHDMHHYIGDGRDPLIIDNTLHLIQFDGEDRKPIVTVVNWTAHPDAMDRGNRYISSEWPHYLRGRVEEHTGSPVVYVSGSVGGQIGPHEVEAIGDDGKVYKEGSFAFAEAWGHSVGDFANKAFDHRKEVADPKLAFRVTRLAVHVENVLYITGFLTGILPRTIYGFDPTKAVIHDATMDNSPLIDTEMAYITLGPAAITTAPGELFPESFLGGYDGSHSGNETPFIHTGPIPGDKEGRSYPAPPDVSLAPPPPYLIDLMDGEPEHRMVFGLTNDMLGYVVPRFEYYLDPVGPYVVEPPGDSHYEETNSLGPRCEPEIVGTMRQLAMSASGKSPF